MTNFRGMLEGENIFLAGYQKACEEWAAGAKARLEQRMDGLAAVLKCRNPAELAAVQVDLSLRQIRSLLESNQRAYELIAKATGEALRKSDGRSKPKERAR